MSNDDDRLVRRAREVFDESVDTLDGERLSKLNQARHRALEQLDRRSPLASWFTVVPAGALAAVALVAVLLTLRVDDTGTPLPGATTAEDVDFELLINDDNLEMLEDLEFYSWLDADAFEDGEQTS